MSLDFSNIMLTHKVDILPIEGKKAIHMIHLLNRDQSLRFNNKKF